MSTSPAKKWFGAVVAALTLTMVASVAPASAATISGSDRTAQMKDSGWGPP
jgi:CDP-diglyceride synthetase